MRWCLTCCVVVVACGGAGQIVEEDGGARDVSDATTPEDAAPTADATALDGATDAGLSVDADVADATTPEPDASVPVACGRCVDGYASSAENAGTVQQSELDEISGLVASVRNPGVLYAHNDSGGKASIYLLSTTGVTLGELVLEGATNADWEDIALGPCPTGSCLYVGEIGDNSLVNPGPYAIYRVPEPAHVSVNASIGTVPATWERLPLRYPNNEHINAETLMVHPVTGDVYVVTKPGQNPPLPGGKSSAYKATAPLNTVSNDLVKLATLKIPETIDLQVTGGSIDPCGDAMLIRTYANMYLFTREEGASFDSLFSGSYSKVTSPIFQTQEKQGEAVTWAPGGGYYTVSEGSSPMLHFVGCQ